MTNLLNSFPTLPIEQQLVLVFWCVCVVMFYSSLVYLVGGLFVNTLKKLF